MQIDHIEICKQYDHQMLIQFKELKPNLLKQL